MFDQAVTLIVYREILEIALILGVVLAATHGLVGRSKWIWLGFAAGTVGAGCVALFASSISAMADGMGQELFNAIIVFSAAIVIGWTAIWMRTHAREMMAHIRQVGKDVIAGKLHGATLSVVIGLAMLREGAEIVLFLYSALLSGKEVSAIAMGGLAGLTLGIITGGFIYMGLMKMSSRYMLRVTGWLLILLVAGLSAQGANYLLAAGYFSDYSAVVWNSSWFLADDSVMGQAMHTLVGYKARPSQIELVFYFGTLITLLALLRITSHEQKLPNIAKATAAVVVVGLVLTFSQQAKALDSRVYSPRVEKGELEIEYATKRTFDNDSSKNNEQKHVLGVGYGITDYWFVELYLAELKREAGGHTDYSGNEIETILQFWPTGTYWLDAGVLAAYGLGAKKHSADEVEFKLLLQKDFGKFTTLVNLGMERGVGNNAVAGNELSSAINTRYRYSPYFEPGIELQSEYGSLGEHKGYNEQKHYLGAIVSGKLLPHVKYEAGYFAGISSEAADSALRFKIEYEFYF